MVIVSVSEQLLESVPVTVNELEIKTGIKLTPFEIPPDQEYVVAVPVPLRITEDPLQTDVSEAFILTDGKGFTTIFILAVSEQPLVSVPITTYEFVVKAGLNPTPFIMPPNQT